MIEKIKKFFFNIFINKKVIFAFLFFISLGLFLPLSQTLAVIPVTGALGILGASIAAIIVALYSMVVLSGLLVIAAAKWLMYVTDPSFFLNTLSYTKPSNPAIEIGLSVTQGFANMVLVLVLVFIALSIILQFKDSEAKKLLPTFIMVALLVNFAPLLAGLVVDASNIIMNYFLNKGAGHNAMISGLTSMQDGFKAALMSWTLLIGQITDNILPTTLLIANNFAVFLILTIFSFVFIARHIAIWILTILSPLAFVLFILPSTRGMARKWWEQLVQWSFVGVGCAFFLYLAGFFINWMDSQGKFVSMWEREINIVPYFIGTAFLYIGFVYGLKTSAIGASTIISFTKKKGIAAGIGTGKWIGGKVGKGIRPMVEQPARKAAGKIVEQAKKVPVARWFIPEKFKQFAEFRPQVEKAQKDAKAYSSISNSDDVMTGAAKGVEATGKILETIQRNDSQDLFQAAKRTRWGKGLSDEELLKNKTFRKILKTPLDIAESSGTLSSLLRSDPRLASVAANTDRERMALINKAVGEARNQHISNWEPEVLHNKDVTTSLLGQFDRNRWLSVSNSVKNGQKTALRSIDSAFSNWKDANPTKEWEDFKKYIKSQNDGLSEYFTALEDSRFRQTGWRKGEYISGDKRWEYGKEPERETSPFAPGAGPTPRTGGSPPPPGGGHGTGGFYGPGTPSLGADMGINKDTSPRGFAGPGIDTKKESPTTNQPKIPKKIKKLLREAGYSTDVIEKMPLQEAQEKSQEWQKHKNKGK